MKHPGFQVFELHDPEFSNVRIPPPKLVVFVTPKETNGQKGLSTMACLAQDLLDLAQTCPGGSVLHVENLVLPDSRHDLSDGISHNWTLDQDRLQVKGRVPI